MTSECEDPAVTLADIWIRSEGSVNLSSLSLADSKYNPFYLPIDRSLEIERNEIKFERTCANLATIAAMPVKKKKNNIRLVSLTPRSRSDRMIEERLIEPYRNDEYATNQLRIRVAAVKHAAARKKLKKRVHKSYSVDSPYGANKYEFRPNVDSCPDHISTPVNSILSSTIQQLQPHTIVAIPVDAEVHRSLQRGWLVLNKVLLCFQRMQNLYKAYQFTTLKSWRAATLIQLCWRHHRGTPITLDDDEEEERNDGNNGLEALNNEDSGGFFKGKHGVILRAALIRSALTFGCGQYNLQRKHQACNIIKEFHRDSKNVFVFRIFNYLKMVRRVQRFVRNRLRKKLMFLDMVVRVFDRFVLALQLHLAVVMSHRGLDMLKGITAVDVHLMRKQVRSSDNLQVIAAMSNKSFHAFLRSHQEKWRDIQKWYSMSCKTSLPLADKHRHLSALLLTKRRQRAKEAMSVRDNYDFPQVTVSDVLQFMKTGEDKVTNYLSEFMKEQDTIHMAKRFKMKMKSRLAVPVKPMKGLLLSITPVELTNIYITIAQQNMNFSFARRHNILKALTPNSLNSLKPMSQQGQAGALGALSPGSPGTAGSTAAGGAASSRRVSFSEPSAPPGSAVEGHHTPLRRRLGSKDSTGHPSSNNSNNNNSNNRNSNHQSHHNLNDDDDSSDDDFDSTGPIGAPSFVQPDQSDEELLEDSKFSMTVRPTPPVIAHKIFRRPTMFRRAISKQS